MQGGIPVTLGTLTPHTCQHVSFILLDAFYPALYQHGYSLFPSTECTLHYLWIKMFAEIYRPFFFFLKITQSANYGAKQVVSTHSLTAPISSLVFIQWPCGVIWPLCIMDTWKMINRSHFPPTRNAVHCPGIMRIFPTCSGKMLHSGKLSSTANETWQQWTSYMFEKQSLKHSEFTW